MSKYKVKVVVADDAIDFEKELNAELEDIPVENVKNVYVRNTSDWSFYAVIVYVED